MLHPAVRAIFVAFALREQPGLTESEAEVAVEHAMKGRGRFNITTTSAHAALDAVAAATKEVSAQR